jgi:hypothetical protein
VDSLEVIQRSTVWFVLGVVVLGIAIIAATRLLARINDDDRDPTIVGALVLEKPGNPLGAAPLYTYEGRAAEFQSWRWSWDCSKLLF